MVKQFILLSAFLLLLPLTSFAQSGASLSLQIEPSFPEIGDTFTVTSYVGGTDKTQTKQSWFVNKSEVHNFTNEDTIMLTAEEIPLLIASRVTFTDGTYVEDSLTISPIRIDLFMDAKTQTPHFYNGASLPTNGSTFSVSALVFKSNIQLNGLSYLWSINGKPQSSAPIKARSSMSFTPSFEENVLVSAANRKIASKSQGIPIVKPEVYFYENNPLRGLSTIALQNEHIFVGDEMTVRAEGYYLQDGFVPGNNHVEWKIDGRSTAPSSEDKQEIVLEKKGESGKAKISFGITNLQNLLQNVTNSIMITF
jgi:hypothetical protein